MGTCSSQVQKPEKENEERNKIRALQQEKGKAMRTKLAQDETIVEDVNMQCRPTKIVEEYQEFVSNMWVEAKDEIDDSIEDMEEVEKFKFLCNLIMISAEVAAKCVQSVLGKLHALLSKPIESGLNISLDVNAIEAPTEEIALMINDHYRKQHNVDMTSLVRRVKEQVSKESKLKETKKILELKEVNEYLEGATKIGWKMALQRPPMTYSTPAVGESWPKNSEECSLDAQYGSNCDDKQAIIHAYVFPILCHGKKQLVRSKVLVGPKNMKFTS